MKRLLLFLLLFNFLDGINAQNISCNELYNYVVENYDYEDSMSCFNSSVLARAEYYEVDGYGFVVAYIKEYDYDYKGKPYIFCSISSYEWINFKSEGISNSWGKAFHKYIRDNTCDCY